MLLRRCQPQAQGVWSVHPNPTYKLYSKPPLAFRNLSKWSLFHFSKFPAYKLSENFNVRCCLGREEGRRGHLLQRRSLLSVQTKGHTHTVIAGSKEGWGAHFLFFIHYSSCSLQLFTQGAQLYRVLYFVNICIQCGCDIGFTDISAWMEINHSGYVFMLKLSSKEGRRGGGRVRGGGGAVHCNGLCCPQHRSQHPTMWFWYW